MALCTRPFKRQVGQDATTAGNSRAVPRRLGSEPAGYVALSAWTAVHLLRHRGGRGFLALARAARGDTRVLELCLDAVVTAAQLFHQRARCGGHVLHRLARLLPHALDLGLDAEPRAL